MDVEFISNNPQTKARPRLDHILSSGVDQLVIGCAFCTRPGVTLLKAHAERLRLPDSFLVVAASDFTDYRALGELDALIPGNLFVHWGSIEPFETKAGSPLMHSKVFYARRGNECWLWTGSHNLTASATQGLNCEAAVLLHGTADEKPFVDALEHLKLCRTAALPYDPDHSWEKLADPLDVLVIHAEANTVPSGPFPLHIHLCLEEGRYDNLFSLFATVKVFLYPAGSLAMGWQRSTPIAALSGQLTGLSGTASNPQSRGSGTPAQWPASAFNIEDRGGVLVVTGVNTPGSRVTTQALLSIRGNSSLNEVLLEEEPRIEKELVPGDARWVEVDPDMVNGFRNPHRYLGMIQQLPVVDRRAVISIAEMEARDVDLHRFRKEAVDGGILEIKYRKAANKKREEFWAPAIQRARFRLRD